MRTVFFLGVLIAWSVLAWAFVFVFAGTQACSLVQPISAAGQSLVPLTDAELAARCNRPDIEAILVFGAGYLVFAVVAINSVVGRSSGDRQAIDPADRRPLYESLRAEFIAGADEESRRRTGRALGNAKLSRMLSRYPGDLPGSPPGT